jgi:arabinose-5-phosphate isomerase
VRQRVVQICAEEVAKCNAALGRNDRPIEAWAGVTAHTREETLANLDFAIAHGADAAVLAPLSIEGVDDPVRFVARDVADLLDARSRRIPVYLYDNADIAIDPRVPHIRTRQVKAMSRLDFVRGIKVSAPKKVLGNYTRAAAGFSERGEFGIYVGNAMLIFDLFRPRTGWLGALAEHWNRYRLRGGLPIGVVAGPANCAAARVGARVAGLPRRRSRAHGVRAAGRGRVRRELQDSGRQALDRVHEARASPPRRDRCAAVAPGTPALAPEHAGAFDAAFERVRAQAREGSARCGCRGACEQRPRCGRHRQHGGRPDAPRAARDRRGREGDAARPRRRADPGADRRRRAEPPGLGGRARAAHGHLRVGADDENGRLLRAAMDRLGIEREIDLAGSASSLAEIFVDDAGERAIYMAPAATSETTAERVRSHASFVARARRVTTEVSQLPLAAARAALELARAAGAATAVDLDVSPSDALSAGLGDEAALDAVLRGADLLKPAKSACRELVPGAGSDPLALARALRVRFGNRAVVVTDGEAGCAIAADGFEGFVRAPPGESRRHDRCGRRVPRRPARRALRRAPVGGSGATRQRVWRGVCRAARRVSRGSGARARARVLELHPGASRALRAAPAAAAPASPAASEALASFGVVVEELDALRRRLDSAAYDAALALLAQARERGGRVHVTGVGKPEHLARYAASLFASTGTPAYFLHATEVAHGSAGQIHAGDVVVAISNSGTTAELLAAVGVAREMGAHVIAVTGALGSPLARAADAALDAGVAREGGPLGLAPRASAAAELLVLAALAAGAERAVGLTRAEYSRRHPAGALGERSRKAD